ncbi:MAG: DUF1329 domain-containing protein, partial [Pseudomonas sp.]
MLKDLRLPIALALCTLWVGPVLAAAPADGAQLGKTLTPLGAQRAGNAAGTIPAWT